MERVKGGEGEVVVNEKKIMNGEYYESIILLGVHQSQKQQFCPQRSINSSQMILVSISCVPLSVL